MKVIYNKTLNKVTWRGDSYKVDGKEVINFPSNILYLTEVISTIPVYDENLEYIEINWVVDENNMEYIKDYIVKQYTQIELYKRDWVYENFDKRLIIDEDVIFSSVYSPFYAFFQLEDFPIEKRLDKIYVWINIIRPDHQQIIDDLISQNLLTLENIPF